MNVSIKKFNVEMEVKNKGIEFEIRTPNDEQHLGDMILSKTGLTWCEGKKAKKNGAFKSWEDIIEIFNKG